MYYLLLIPPLSDVKESAPASSICRTPVFPKWYPIPYIPPILPESFYHPVPGMTVVHNNQIPSQFPLKLYRKIFRYHSQISHQINTGALFPSPIGENINAYLSPTG